MRVLLVNTNRIKPPVAPLALDYLAAALEREGHEPALLDLCWEADAERAAAAAFAGKRPDLAAVSFRNTDDCYFASGCSFVPVLERDIALLRRHYDGPLVVGGGGFSLLPERLLDAVEAPWGLIGDGETGLPALLRAVAGDLPLASVPGLVYRVSGTWRRNPPQPLDLARISLAPRRLIDNARYFRHGGQAGVETKRGCPGRCIYCADPAIKGRSPRLRPPDDVVAEMRSLLAQGADCLHLCDSEFNLPQHHALAVCRAVADAGLGRRMRWYTYACPVPFPRALLRAMQRAGCVGINFGVDSGSDRMLAALGRSFTAEQIRETARLCREARMVFMFDLLLGAPGETWESVRETIELANAAGPDCVGVSLGVRVYPGTPLAGHLRNGILPADGLTGDPDSAAPAFTLAPALGENPLARVRELIGGDPRFFLPVGGDAQDYNYNDNTVLQGAIEAGARGAYWDILRRMRGGD